MRRKDEKTVGLDWLIHKELSRWSKSNHIKLKDAVRCAIVNYLCSKPQKNDR